MDEKNDKIDTEEVVFEEEIVEDEAELEEANDSSKGQQKIAKLRKKLTEAEEEKRKFHEELQRARADFLNSKRRLEDQFQNAKERANDPLILELLSLADSFENARADTDVWDTIEEKWRTGVEAIHAKLNTILASQHVTAINPLGEPFNPSEHEAVSSIKVQDDNDVDRVITVLQKGYKRNDSILRPARVIVGTK